MKRHFLRRLMKYEPHFPKYWGSGVTAWYRCSHHSCSTSEIWWKSTQSVPAELFSEDIWQDVSSAAEEDFQFVMVVFSSSTLSQQLSWRGGRLSRELQVLKHLCRQETRLNKLSWFIFLLLPLLSTYATGAASCRQLQCCFIGFFGFLLFSQQLLFKVSTETSEHVCMQCYINAVWTELWVICIPIFLFDRGSTQNYPSLQPCSWQRSVLCPEQPTINSLLCFKYKSI